MSLFIHHKDTRILSLYVTDTVRKPQSLSSTRVLVLEVDCGRPLLGSRAEALSHNLWLVFLTILLNKKEGPILNTNGFVLELLPNPFYSSVSITYGLAKISDVFLEVYNLNGQCVRTLVREREEPGIYKLNWDGRDNKGKPLPCGVYFVRLGVGNKSQTKKLGLLRWYHITIGG